MSASRRIPLMMLLAAGLCTCSNAPEVLQTVPPAHLVTSDGTPVSGAPEPEVVRLKKIEVTDPEKHITVENAAGEYVLACIEEANKKEYAVQSCLSPRPQQDYLLFRSSTKWLIKGATEPMSLKFMENWAVEYNRGENIGLLPAAKTDTEQFGVYWLLSWSQKKPTH